MRALSDSARWEPSPALPPQSRIHEYLLGLPSQDTLIRSTGDAVAAGGPAIEATYRRPYQVHGAIGPSCAVAHFSNGLLTIWTYSQGVFPLRAAIAEMLAMPLDKLRCIHMEGAGCYGHNGADDAAADAALLAVALPDKPVRVQLMREQEHAWEPFGAAMIAKSRATLDASGRIASWQYDVWSNTHSMRPGKAGHLAPAQLLATPFAVPPPQAIPQPEGGGDRNAIPLYTIANARITHHFIPAMPLRVSALRALGAYANVFAIESFVDELALAAKADPVEFRLKHLDDARGREVIHAAAEQFGWSGFGRARNRGRGFAFARYKNLAAYCAIAMDVEVERETGQVRIGRVVAAVDSGEAVNPDGIRNQIEGGIVQSLSWTLLETVTWDATHVTSRDWSSYPILRFPQLPKRIDVHVVDRPGEHFLGTGEAAQGPAGAALANAVADAIGVRIRDIPLDPARIRSALGA
jgi:CO/xanthine dehydrogenase Mo-binding subunit